MVKSRLRSALGIVAIVSSIAVAPAAQTATSPKFDVVSVKPNKTGIGGGPYFMPGGRLRAGNMTVKVLMRVAYSYRRNGPLYDFEILGGPTWIDADGFDIEASAVVRGASDPDALPRLQALLVDRFKLKVHTETRRLPVYALVKARADGQLGPSLRRSKMQCPETAAPPPPANGSTAEQCGLRIASGKLTARGVDISHLARNLADLRPVQRWVLEKTGLTGPFDVDLEWTTDPQVAAPLDTSAPPPPMPANSGPSLFTALQEQLGLKLEPTTGPVDVLVIDHVERPTAD